MKEETLIFTHHVFQDDIVQSKQSSREWYHLTRMYYPWVKFSQGLACLVKDYVQQLIETRGTLSEEKQTYYIVECI